MNQNENSIFIPKSDISQVEIDNQLKIRTDLQGALESGSLQVTSVYLRYMVYLIVIITIVCLFIFYLSNPDNKFISIISIILLLLIILWLAQILYRYLNSVNHTHLMYLLFFITIICLFLYTIFNPDNKVFFILSLVIFLVLILWIARAFFNYVF